MNELRPFRDGATRCRRLGIAFGVIGLATGIPWLVFGYQRHRAQKAWKQRHGLSQVSGFELAMDRGGASFAFRVSFYSRYVSAGE